MARAGLFSLSAQALAWRVTSMAAVTLGAVVTGRQLGPAGRGVVILVLTLSAVGVALGSGGIHFSGRLLLVSPTDRIRPGGYVGLALGLAASLGLASALAGVAVLPAAHVQVGPALAAAVGAVAASSLLQLLLVEQLQAFGFSSRAAGVDALSSIVQLILVAAVAGAGVATAAPFLCAVAISNGFGTLAALGSLRRQGVEVRPRYRPEEWRRLLGGGRPGLAVGLAELLMFRLDRYIVAVVLLPSAVGIYGVAATAPEMLRLPVAAVAQPVFYRLAAGAASLEDFRRTRQVVLAATAAGVVVMAALAPLVVEVAFGPAYRTAVTPLRILLLSEFGVALFYLDGSALAGLGRTRESAWAAGVGLAVTTLGDLLFIPVYGLAGAAWASVVGYSVMGGITHICARRRPRAALSNAAPP